MSKGEAECTQEHEHQELMQAEERQCYKEESEHHITAMNKQMEILQDLVHGHIKEAKKDNDRIKLTQLTETDDIESYLTTFEYLMKLSTASLHCP